MKGPFQSLRKAKHGSALGGATLHHHRVAARADGERARLDIRRSAFRARHPNPREGNAACRAR